MQKDLRLAKFGDVEQLKMSREAQSNLVMAPNAGHRVHAVVHVMMSLSNINAFSTLSMCCSNQFADRFGPIRSCSALKGSRQACDFAAESGTTSL